MKPPFTATHDPDGDVLYIHGSDNRGAVGYEVVPGVLLRFATDNGELVGITLVDASNIRRELKHQ